MREKGDLIKVVAPLQKKPAARKGNSHAPCDNVETRQLASLPVPHLSDRPSMPVFERDGLPQRLADDLKTDIGRHAMFTTDPKEGETLGKFLRERIVVAVRVRPMHVHGSMGGQVNQTQAPDIQLVKQPLIARSFEKTPEMYLTNSVELRENCVAMIDLPHKPSNGQKRDFCFDAVYSPNSSQRDIFHDLVEPMIQTCLSGFNGCVFCYGQTGSGKTYTMTGPLSTQEKLDSKNENLGIVYRAGAQIIQTLEQDALNLARELQVEHLPNWKGIGPHVALQASYIEIYNDQLRDLLVDYDRVTGVAKSQLKRVGPSTIASEELRVIENVNPVSGEREKLVENASLVDIKCLKDLFDVVQHGQHSRVVAATKMNEESSRSHAVLTLGIITNALTRDMLQENIDGEDSDSVSSDLRQRFEFDNLAIRVLPRASKINLVDLAGSERQTLTGTKGQQLKEACSINSSLFCLGNVINALVSHQSHIPHRNSKLTYLLSDSLGGNSLTLMLACIAPSAAHFEETLSTLRFADRAKMVKSNAKANVDKNILRIQELERQLAALIKVVNYCQVHHGPMRKNSTADASSNCDASCQCPVYATQMRSSNGFFGRLFGKRRSILAADIQQLPSTVSAGNGRRNVADGLHRVHPAT